MHVAHDQKSDTSHLSKAAPVLCRSQPQPALEQNGMVCRSVHHRRSRRLSGCCRTKHTAKSLLGPAVRQVAQPPHDVRPADGGISVIANSSAGSPEWRCRYDSVRVTRADQTSCLKRILTLLPHGCYQGKRAPTRSSADQEVHLCMSSRDYPLVGGPVRNQPRSGNIPRD